MHRLNGGDIQFIYPERSWRHLHTIKVLVLDPAETGATLSVERTREVVAAKLGRLDPLRWRLQTVPGHVYHPLWVETGDVDLDHHVRAVTAAPPGDLASLSETISRVTSARMPRDRPLWDLTFVDGLDGGRVALVLRLHHALADGSASLELIGELLDDAPDAPLAATEVPPADPTPSAVDLVRDGARDLGGLLARMPSLVGRLGRAAAAKRHQGSGGARAAMAFTTAETRFNRPLRQERIVSIVELPLEPIRQVKDVLGGTVNDVFLALCSAAVRGYLLERGELPSHAMSAAVPASVRHEIAPDERWGNYPSNLFMNLATDEADLRGRYDAIRASQAAAKEWHDTRQHSLMFDWMEVYPLWVAYSRYLPAVVQRLMKRPSFSLIASNVRGPTERLYHCGAPMVALYSMGPLVQELGLNITAWSYCGVLAVSAHACREHVPDLQDLIDRFPPALDELVALAASVAAGDGGESSTSSVTTERSSRPAG